MEHKKKPEDKVKESLITYEVYAHLPDDGNRYEVADGELQLMSPGPNLYHQVISLEIHNVLNQACRNEYIILTAPLDVILSDTEIRQPDLMMVHRERMSILHKKGIVGAPDLVVEISSEYSRRRDKVDKIKVYAKYGVLEYWIVDLTNYTLEQYQLKDNRFELMELYAEDDVIRSERLRCVSFTMNQLIRELPAIQA